MIVIKKNKKVLWDFSILNANPFQMGKSDKIKRKELNKIAIFGIYFITAVFGKLENTVYSKARF